jgi:hypothetical protein
MQALRQALDAGFDVSVSTMVHRENLTDFDSMERMFKEIGIKDWTVDVPCATGRLREHAEFFVSPEEGGKYLGYGFGGGLHSSEQGFGCGLHLMAVMAGGKIAKCTFYEDRAVGAVEQGLMNAWRKIDGPAQGPGLRVNMWKCAGAAAGTERNSPEERAAKTSTGAYFMVYYKLKSFRM